MPVLEIFLIQHKERVCHPDANSPTQNAWKNSQVFYLSHNPPVINETIVYMTYMCI